MRGLKNDWKDLRLIDKQLCEALESKDFDSVDKLISEGANVKVRFGKNINDTPLHYFVYDFDIVRKLIKCGAYIDPINRHFETPLHYTILYTSPASVARLLLKNGANPHVQERYDHYPLYDAIGKYHKREHIIALLSQRVNVNLNVGHCRNTSFQQAIQRGLHKFIVKYMVLYGYEIVDQLQEIQHHSNREEIISFWLDCNDEFQVLRRERINPTRKLADLLKLIEWNENTVEPSLCAIRQFEAGVYTSNYPIYSDMTAERFNYFIKRRSELMNRLDCVRLISKSEAKVEIITDCKRHLATFLGDKDLKMFIRAAVLSCKDQSDESVEAVTDATASNTQVNTKRTTMKAIEDKNLDEDLQRILKL